VNAGSPAQDRIGTPTFAISFDTVAAHHHAVLVSRRGDPPRRLTSAGLLRWRMRHDGTDRLVAPSQLPTSILPSRVSGSATTAVHWLRLVPRGLPWRFGAAIRDTSSSCVWRRRHAAQFLHDIGVMLSIARRFRARSRTSSVHQLRLFHERRQVESIVLATRSAALAPCARHSWASPRCLLPETAYTCRISVCS
jgi:hypothetical protein